MWPQGRQQQILGGGLARPPGHADHLRPNRRRHAVASAWSAVSGPGAASTHPGPRAAVAAAAAACAGLASVPTPGAEPCVGRGTGRPSWTCSGRPTNSEPGPARGNDRGAPRYPHDVREAAISGAGLACATCWGVQSSSCGRRRWSSRIGEPVTPARRDPAARPAQDISQPAADLTGSLVATGNAELQPSPRLRGSGYQFRRGTSTSDGRLAGGGERSRTGGPATVRLAARRVQTPSKLQIILLDGPLVERVHQHALGPAAVRDALVPTPIFFDHFVPDLEHWVGAPIGRDVAKIAPMETAFRCASSLAAATVARGDALDRVIRVMEQVDAQTTRPFERSALLLWTAPRAAPARQTRPGPRRGHSTNLVPYRRRELWQARRTCSGSFQARGRVVPEIRPVACGQYLTTGISIVTLWLVAAVRRRHR